MFWRKKKNLLLVSMFATFALYISLVSAFTLLLKAACVCVYFFSFSLFFYFLWSDAFFFIKAIDLLQCLNDPGPHTPTSQTVQTQKIKCTDNQKERTNGAAAGAQGLGRLLGMSGHAEPQTFRHDMTLAMFACTSAARSLVEVSTVFNCLQEPVTEPAWCYWFTSRPVL